MRVLITGGTGLIGGELSKSLTADGHQVVILTRSSRPSPNPQTTFVRWDAETAEGWGHLVNEVDAIVNLAGEGIADGRWSDARKKRIYTSRIAAGKAVMQALQLATTLPKVLIQSSAVGYYGPRGDEILDETSAPGADFLAQVCFDWEASTADAEAMGIRRAVIRTGIVLSNDGGAWPKIVLPFKLFAGGPMGSGRQYWPWIHIDDEIRAIRFLLENPEARGVFNLSAPTPLSNKEFAARVGSVMGRPAFFPAPAPALKLALGDMSTVLLDGQRAIPAHLQKLGFTFQYPELDAAVRQLTA
jgi:uncharacterized protein (TIGR01777 family)